MAPNLSGSVTFAAIDPALQRRTKRRAAAFGTASLALVTYQLWVLHSNAAAARVFRASDSCAFLFADSSKAAPEGACRREFATVVARPMSPRSSRSWPHYYVVTRSASGALEKSELTSYNDRSFWEQVRLNERVAILRFIAPGYHLSGRIARIAGASGDVTTANRPGSHAGGAVPLAIFGTFMFLFFVLAYVSAANAGRRIEWTTARASS